VIAGDGWLDVHRFQSQLCQQVSGKFTTRPGKIRAGLTVAAQYDLDPQLRAE
jgi:hypothetical protein